MFDYAYQYEKVKPGEAPLGEMTTPGHNKGHSNGDRPRKASSENVLMPVSSDGSIGGGRSAPVQGVEWVYKKYHRLLIGYLRNRLVNKDEAEDVAQEVYYRLYRRRGIAELEHPKAFVLQTAANLLVDINRVRARHQASHHIQVDEVEEQLFSQEPNPEDIARHRETLADIDRLLGELPPKCQAVFLMHRLDGATHQAIAEALGISVSMVEKYISKALLHLRTGMEVDHG